MRLFDLARKPPDWLRACLASLLLALALGSVGHAQHAHDEAGSRAVDAALCGLCVSFDRMVDGPATRTFVATPVIRFAPAAAPAAFVVEVRSTLRLVPRGPPAA